MKNFFSRHKTIIIVVIIVAAVLGFIIGRVILNNEKTKFSTVEVKRGNVVQTVSETGTVGLGDNINLSFKAPGKIQSIFVNTGDKVFLGQSLAKLDASALSFQYQNAQASLAAAQANLDKLVNGPTPYQIDSSQTSVSNTQVSLNTANKNLSDSYQSAENTLDSAYLYAYNTLSVINTMQRTYFSSSDQETAQFLESKTLAENSLKLTKNAIDLVKKNNQPGDIDNALSQTKDTLGIFAQTLSIIRQLCDDNIYINRVSSTDKTSLDTQRTYINTALSSVVSAQQTISAKESAVTSAQGQLASAQDQLNLLTAKPRQEDIDLYKAQVQQAQSQVDLYSTQTNDATLKSPVAGVITAVNNKAGEVAQGAVITMLPDVPFKIDVDIYEGDIVKVAVGNHVDINLTAFPDKILSGTVTSIDPAQKIVDGVVYYKTTINFQNPPENLKPGMTADITIKTTEKDNVLMILGSAITEKNGGKFVQVLNGANASESRQVETGLAGDDNSVEIISGLKEGEKVITQ